MKERQINRHRDQVLCITYRTCSSSFKISETRAQITDMYQRKQLLYLYIYTDPKFLNCGIAQTLSIY